MSFTTSYGPIGSGTRPASDSGFAYERPLSDADRAALDAIKTDRQAYIDRRAPEIAAALKAERQAADAAAARAIQETIWAELRALPISRPHATDLFGVRAERTRHDVADFLARRTEDDAAWLAAQEWDALQRREDAA